MRVQDGAGQEGGEDDMSEDARIRKWIEERRAGAPRPDAGDVPDWAIDAAIDIGDSPPADTLSVAAAIAGHAGVGRPVCIAPDWPNAGRRGKTVGPAVESGGKSWTPVLWDTGWTPKDWLRANGPSFHESEGLKPC